MTAKSQQTQKWQAHKDLLKLREDLASSSSVSSSDLQADLEISSLVQVSLHSPCPTKEFSTVRQLSGQVSLPSLTHDL